MADELNDGRDTPKRPVLPLVASLAVAVALTAGRGRGRRGTPSRPPQPVDDRPGRPTQSALVGRGLGAASPLEIPPHGWWDVVRRIVTEIQEDRILAVAAGVTFFSLLALFPAIAALVSLYGLVADPATLNDHVSAVNDLLPGGAIDIFTEQVKRITAKGQATLGFAFFFGLALSLWSANAGMKAMFDALNVAYEVRETRNFVVLNLWSLAFTLASVALIGITLSAVVVIPVVLKFFWLGAATEWIVWAGRWPILLAISLLALGILYRYGPSRPCTHWVWLSPGAILAAIGAIATSMLFSWYVASFGSYNETYGSLGAVIGLMTWMWLTSTVILVGAELNAEAERQTGQGARSRGGHRPAEGGGKRAAATGS